MSRRADENGMALLTVLLLVAVMAVLAVAVIDDVRFAIRRTANAETLAQAQWYALGAEDLARIRIGALSRANPVRTPIQPSWNGQPLAFPIEEGTIRAVVTDGQACFNLNSVVEGGGGQRVGRPAGARQFVALARALGLPEGKGRSLAAALTDWIDNDATPQPGGAEDPAYAALARPYRTSGVLLSEVSELRAIQGFDASSYARLRPFVCALPVTDLSPINVNTISQDQAVLLTMLTEGRLSASAARGVVAGRPADGWSDINAFWGQPRLAAVRPSDETYDQVTVKTRFFALQTEVAYAGAEAVMSALLEARPGGVRTVARRWTRPE